jgi:hypothetical protein
MITSSPLWSFRMGLVERKIKAEFHDGLVTVPQPPGKGKGLKLS